jgi:prepilin-type N-terminal cleavage/methylation domain-containing protein
MNDCTTHRPNSIDRAGFTLVELLVVIGIIAVLISVLVPVLAGARARAQNVQCLSNLRQIAHAALMYANENHGWLPPGHSANPAGAVGISRTDSAFCDYGPTSPNRWIVSETMARLCTYRWSPQWDASKSLAQNQAAGWKPTDTPVFFCPTQQQFVAGAQLPKNNLLNHDPSLVNGDANSCTKMSYLWVANPWHNMSAGTINAVSAIGEDLLAARTSTSATGNMGFCHMDVDPNQTTKSDFDENRPCKPGIDYLRKLGDKHSADVAICVDNATQMNASATKIKAGFFYPHGNMTGSYTKPWPDASGAPNYIMTIAPKAWFNEVYGDAHAESRRGDQLRMHWSSANPQVW